MNKHLKKNKLTPQQWALMIGQKVQYGANEKDLHQETCIGISQEFLELLGEDDVFRFAFRVGFQRAKRTYR